MSAVDLTEFVSKVLDKQPDALQIRRLLDDVRLEIAGHSAEQAFVAGLLRGPTPIDPR